MTEMRRRGTDTTITAPTLKRGGEILTPMRRGPLLLVLYGDELGKRYHLEASPLVFGRSLDCDRVLDNPSVSRRHFQVTVEDAEVFIDDVGSTNGTFVNGIKLVQRVPLNSGDLISIGNLILKYLPYEESERFFSRELFRLSTIDPLTDAYNKHFFVEILAKEVDRSLRYQHSLSLLVLDVDGFAKVNAAHGDHAGDAVLRGIGRLIMEAVRKQDIFARYEDDAFSVLLPETDLERTLQVAERLRRSVESHSFRLDANTNLSVTCSLGVAALAEATSSVATMLKRADDALERAKSAGRNRVST
jgi:diguanylate cyclase (GGDEF)-like protein